MKVTILGSGVWATALAQVLAENQHQVILYGKEQDVIDEINQYSTNSKYFSKELVLNSNIKATTNSTEALKDTKIIVIALATIAIHEVILNIKHLITEGTILINASKGLDPITNELFCLSLSKLFEQKVEIASIMGPGFAMEVIKKQLTAVNAASSNIQTARFVQTLFSNQYFRVYATDDIIGTEIGASIKNVIAIAAGIAEGLGYQINTRAALITRGLAEIIRFGCACGAKKMTFVGLSGVGDLILTCSSRESRNFSSGYQIGFENDVKKFLINNKSTVEGIRTTKVIYEQSQKMNIEMPIVEAIYRILYQESKPSEVIKGLMTRELKDEF